MTKDQILAMKPGRELDALVAENVFGWGKDKVYHELKMVRQDLSYLPHYSTEIRSILSVMARMQISVICSEDGWYAVVTDDIIHRHSREHKYKEVYGKHWALADNIPEAICKAALCAVIAKEES